MSGKAPFRFQQFVVRDDRAAMKIGTDGVLLGAWTPIRGAKKILDVGTGCGLVALMLAQRTVALNSQISAIDIDVSAASQALENFTASGWNDRLPSNVDEISQSLNRYAQGVDRRFDLIVCNPPFFASPASVTKPARQIARHGSKSERQQMLHDMASLLDTKGRLGLILPFDQAIETTKELEDIGFGLQSRTDVFPRPDARPKRVLLEYSKDHTDANSCQHDELIVETARHQYSEGYAKLTCDFHLRYA